MPTKAAVKAAPRKRNPNAGRRNSYQEEKRKRTRAAILSAAAKVLSVTPFIFVSIDEIIKAASTSRATFYSHFQTKLGIAFALYEDITPDWIELWDLLTAIAPTDTAGLTDWLRRMADLYISHGYVSMLTLQLDAVEPEFHARLNADRELLIDRLATRSPAFAVTSGKSSVAIKTRVKARLLMARIDYVSAQIAVRGDLLDVDVALQVVAEELSEFLRIR
jgi:AcrR family transcriptional regulator